MTYLSCFKISGLAPYSWKSGGAGIRWLEFGASKAVLFGSFFSFLNSYLIIPFRWQTTWWFVGIGT